MDRFEIDDNAIQYGSFMQSADLTLPMKRAAQLASIFPIYSPRFGYTEWGRGWVVPSFTLIRRGRRGPPKYDEHDALESPWGLLWPGLGGHFPVGFDPPVAATLGDDTVVVKLPNGDTWTFGGSDKVIRGGGSAEEDARGVGVWMLARIDSTDGDTLVVDYCRVDQQGPCAINGRFYPQRLRWLRGGGTAPPTEVARADVEYEIGLPEITDYALATRRVLDRRVISMTFSLRHRTTGVFAPVARYVFTHDDAMNPYLLTGIEEIHIDEQGRTESHATRYNYGKSAFERSEAPLLTPLAFGSAFPAFDDYASRDVHALSPGETSLHLSPGDFDGDQAMDFVGRRNRWWAYDESDPSAPTYDEQFVKKSPNADEACVGVRASIDPIVVEPGATRPSLVGLTKVDTSNRQWTLTQCDIHGASLQKLTLVLSPLPQPLSSECGAPATGPAMLSADEIQRQLIDVDADKNIDLVMFDRCSVHVWKGREPQGGLLQFDACQASVCSSRVVAAEFLDPAKAHSVFDVNGDSLPDVTEGHRSWMNRGVDRAGIPMIGTPDQGELGSVPNQPVGTPGLCHDTFTHVNGDEYIDEVEHCKANAVLFVRYGSGSGFRRLAEPIVLDQHYGDVLNLPLGKPDNPGVLLIGKAKERKNNDEACPLGTRPSKGEVQTDFGIEVKYWCSPPLTWLALRSADTGLLTSAENDRGTRVSYRYVWSPAGGGQPVLAEIHRSTKRIGTTTDVDEVQEFDYVDPWRDAGSGRSGFATVERRSWTSTDPNAKSVTTFVYGRQGRLTWLASTTDTSPSGRTLTRVERHRSVVGVRGVEALRLDGVVELLAHNDSTGAPALGFVQRSATSFTYDTRRPLCLATHEITKGSERLTVTYVYDQEPTPLEVAGAISCQPRQKTIAGSHADPTLDFQHTELMTYTPSGKLDSLVKRGRDASLTTHTFEYWPDGLLRSSQELGKEKVFFDYEPARRTSPAGAKTRLLKSVQGRAAIAVSSEFQYEPLRDLLAETQTRSGAASGVSGTSYDTWGRVATEWNSNAGGPEAPWHLIGHTLPSANAPGRVLETVRLNTDAARRSLVLLDSGLDPQTVLTEWDRSSSAWRLVSHTEPASAGVESMWSGSVLIAPDGGAHLRYGDLDGLLDRSSGGPIQVASRDFDGRGLTGKSREYISPEPPPGGLEGGTWRQWTHRAQLDSTGDLKIAARSSTPGCDPQVFVCPPLFVSRVLDGLGRVVSQTDENDRTTKTEFDMLGRVRRIRLPSGETQAYGFDDLGRLTHVRRDQHVLELGYSGMLLSSSQRSSHDGTVVERTQIKRTNFATIESMVFERPCATAGTGCVDSLVWLFQEDGNPLLIASPMPIGVRGRGFERGQIRRIDGAVMLDEIKLSPAYDPATSSTFGAAPWRRVAKSYTRFADASVESVKTEVFVGTSKTPSWSIVQRTVLDPTGRPREVWIDDEKFVTIERDPLVTTYTFRDGGSVFFFHRDALRTRDGKVAIRAGGTNGNGLWGLVLHRDVNGRIGTQELFDDAGEQTFGISYLRGQVQKITSGATTVAEYAYGTDGLLKATTLADGQRHEITRSADRIAIANGPSWTLDALGRPTSRGSKRFTWGPRGQIARVVDGADVTEFFYDETDARILTVARKNGGEQASALVGNTLVTENDVHHDLVIDGHLFGTFVGNAKQFVAANYNLQNTLLATGSTRIPLPTPYGVRAVSGGVPEFAGGRFDPATEMIRLGVRDYIPELGQFASPDPLFANDTVCLADPAGCGLFAYAGGDPVNWSDPSGYAQQDDLCDEFGCASDENVIYVNIPQEPPRFSLSFSDMLPRGFPLRAPPRWGARLPAGNISAGIAGGGTAFVGAQVSVSLAMDTAGNVALVLSFVGRIGMHAGGGISGQFAVGNGLLQPGEQSSEGGSVDFGPSGGSLSFSTEEVPVCTDSADSFLGLRPLYERTMNMSSPQVAVGRFGPSFAVGFTRDFGRTITIPLGNILYGTREFVSH